MDKHKNKAKPNSLRRHLKLIGILLACVIVFILVIITTDYAREQINTRYMDALLADLDSNVILQTDTMTEAGVNTLLQSPIYRRLECERIQINNTESVIDCISPRVSAQGMPFCGDILNKQVIFNDVRYQITFFFEDGILQHVSRCHYPIGEVGEESIRIRYE
ncbi:MAG: hypothetical protein AAFV93_16625 [Chloroflexota bacterium]